MLSNLTQFLFHFVHLSRQGPVGSQHSEPDAHSDQHQEGWGRERKKREEKLALRKNHHKLGIILTRYYLKEKIGAEEREGDDGGAAKENNLKHCKQEPG